MENSPPLYIDLDECLVLTNVLAEGCFAMLKLNPLNIFLMLYWLMNGRARLKREIALRVTLDAAHLPYHPEFLAFLSSERQKGRRLVLATSANELPASAVARHLALFDGVISSNGVENNKGAAKLRAIQRHCGSSTFDYAGNSHADLPIWKYARRAIVVNATPGVSAAVNRLGNVAQTFPGSESGIGDYVQEIRWHQWFKNALLFVPLLSAHAWNDVQAIGAATVGFLAFSFCASATYVLNDLFDLESDRRHPTKRNRPLAAGRIPIDRAVILSVMLMLLGVALAASVGLAFLAYTLVYVASTLAYSLRLKSFVLVDAITLAGLYTLRVIAGGAATDIPISFWLLAMSGFLFLSLALVKRWSELTLLAANGTLAPAGRDYRLSDLPIIGAMGIASGYIAVAVLALYVQSPDVSLRYTRPEILWLLCPVMLYWISRMWVKAGRGEMHDDPLIYTLRDRASRILMAVGGAVVLAATFL